ncbi:hypothetical protein D9M68_888540 [compost metagenome]
MSLPMSVNVGLDGVSPVTGGGAEDTGTYAIGVGAAIYNQYFVDLKYVDAFGKSEKCDSSGSSLLGVDPAGSSGDGSTPNAFSGNENYACYAGGYSSFSGGAATTEDRGAVYLTLKTTF